MPYLPALNVASPVLFTVAAVFACAAVAATIMRRPALPRTTLILAALGTACLALAAGELTWRRALRGRVAVMVDVSPSTRSATFRDRAQLRRRLEQLLGPEARAGRDYVLYQFAQQVTPVTPQTPRGEQWTARTMYAPPPGADAVLLFTDGQFELPPAAASPPTYVVADPALDEPEDAAVERLEARGDGFAATVRVAGRARQLVLGQTGGRRPVTAGRTVAAWASDEPYVDVSVAPRDRWRENDGMWLFRPPPRTLQRWWISASSATPPPPPGWTRFAPADLPTDAARYLSAGAIALDNVSADTLSRVQRERLEQYVRDLGGGLLILGGASAFAAGGYAGTPLETLSPLASNPPSPGTHWIVLADSSGSMAGGIGDNTRWHFAVNAIGQLIPLLPADDPLSAGDFARATRWWCRDQRVRDVDPARVLPRNIRPTGPTNLAPALRDVASWAGPGLPSAVLLVTDAEAKIDAAEPLAAELAAKRVRVHVLSTGPVAAVGGLRTVVDRTGGQLLAQTDPRQWAAGLHQLFRTASLPWLERVPATVAFNDEGLRVPPISAPLWNRTWLKAGATVLASAQVENDTAPMAAAWNLGTGAVIALAFPPPPGWIDPLADRVFVPPRDPRFVVTWDHGWPFRVTLDARDTDGRYLNDLRPALAVSAGTARPKESTPIPQVAPGRYEATFDTSERGSLAAVYLDDALLDHVALPGRYAAEFARIGNDRATMRALADTTGGRVIEHGDARPIELPGPSRDVPLTPYLAAGGATLVGMGLMRWRIG